MGRSRKKRGGGYELTTDDLKNLRIEKELEKLQPQQDQGKQPLLPEPPPSAPYEPRNIPFPPSALPYNPPLPPLSPDMGSFTRPIPGIRSTLTWAQLRDLSTTQFTEAEAAGVTDPHELYRSLVGADGNRLLEALRGALNDRDLLDVRRTDEISGLLLGWMNVRRGLGLPPIMGLDGAEITVDSLGTTSCRLSDRADLADYSDTWRVIASFVQARPDRFKAAFAEAFIPSAIAGGNGGLPCLEGFCHYALLKMRDAVTTCFVNEDRAHPTVIPPMTGILKLRRGRTTVSAFLETAGASVEGALTIEPYRVQIMALLQRTYPGVVWTDNDITTIFNELRIAYGESYRGGKTRRKRRRRSRNRFQTKV